MPDCRVRECVFNDGGATWAAAVVTCAQVLICVVGLVGVMALGSRVACHLQWHLHLDDLAGNVVGLLLGLMVVVTRGKLMDFTVGLLMGTFGIGYCRCMECVICLLSLVWGMGMLVGACTLGTHCML